MRILLVLFTWLCLTFQAIAVEPTPSPNERQLNHEPYTPPRPPKPEPPKTDEPTLEPTNEPVIDTTDDFWTIQFDWLH